tara:strand:- start:10118 stop:10576 length:459 start_codon:yes stop_codon:yes gene_type:complete
MPDSNYKLGLSEFLHNVSMLKSQDVAGYVLENLKNVRDDSLGFSYKPVPLKEVLAYRESEEHKDFDFFETYENSEAAQQNIALSNKWLDNLRELDEDQLEFVDALQHAHKSEILSIVSDKIKTKVEAIEEEKKEKAKAEDKSKADDSDKAKE